MRLSVRAFALASLLLAAAHGAGHAQMPGGSPTGAGSFRRAYLSEAYQAVESLVVEWESAWLNSDAEALSGLYTDDAFYFSAASPDGAMGRRAVKAALAGQFANRRELHTKMVDFTASGDMAYYAGRYYFQADPSRRPVQEETGTFVLILQHSSRGWRIRSHVEKPDPTPSPAQNAQAAAPSPAPADTPAAPPPAQSQSH